MRVGASLIVSLVIVGMSAAARPAWPIYHDPTNGWRLQHPVRFHREKIAFDNGRFILRGVSVSNVALSLDPDVLHRLPANVVLVRFWKRDGGPFVGPEPLDSRFPLLLERFQASTWTRGWRVLHFQAGGVPFDAGLWLGRRVSARDRADARRIVASFEPRPIRRGWQDSGPGLFALRRARSYPVRSVRLFHPRAARPEFVRPDPFYLVHAPRGFYTISARRTIAAGPTRCVVRFDPRRFEFSCPNGDRWDRLGRVIRYKHSRSRASERLAAHVVTLAFDGHVLVATGSIATAPRDAWP